MIDSAEANAQEPAIVCVIDDEAEVRSALGSLLRASGYGVALFEAPEAFRAAGAPDGPSCLVLDVRLKGLSGIDFQAELAQAGVLIPVIVMTGYGDIPMSVQAMKTGAIDFLPKPFEDEAMLSAVAAAIERDRQRRASEAKEAGLRGAYQSLTAREREVMSLVVAGLMNKQVAARLDLSEITVKIHRGAMMKKMGAQSLADLVRMAEILNVRDVSAARFQTSV
ncbi:two component transcriptional regulator, LuxR family [Methylocella silvestris BL2]|uniref:Two component transcriptional regulator, LuxR family n=1 Tax=Methylocella silvestris (strain DSM 15510 / CIP 108128 / LMG 27833 / NCIMB 13906 / BL2) TaxID=395965 RepID=B8ERQ6_METSB|nr:response regulator [Methylocella silvestris]ACK51604.1 two component transcriptional regulator, LuxR family [Methylocella silvestris BL2]